LAKFDIEHVFTTERWGLSRSFLLCRSVGSTNSQNNQEFIHDLNFKSVFVKVIQYSISGNAIRLMFLGQFRELFIPISKQLPNIVKLDVYVVQHANTL